MPKLDKEGRITICLDLRNKLAVPYENEIALCFEENKIFIVNDSEASEYKVIAFRKFDQKGRLFFPKEAMEVLNASIDDMLIVYLYNNKIYISKNY